MEPSGEDSVPVFITNTISKDYVREFLKHSSGASVHQS
jgi:hypothetical protein